MRVVTDTNILARAARGGTSPAAEVVRLLTSDPHLLILSPFLLSELSRVLRYERVRQIHGLDEAGIDAYLQQLQTAALIVNPPDAGAAGVVRDDPDDDPVIATAVAGQAEVLCTLDRHLRQPDVCSYCARHGIQVMTDVELLARLRQINNPQTSTEE
jgi:putative PIN family toxin of toxin-antitoxin system